MFIINTDLDKILLGSESKGTLSHFSRRLPLRGFGLSIRGIHGDIRLWAGDSSTFSCVGSLPRLSWCVSKEIRFSQPALSLSPAGDQINFFNSLGLYSSSPEYGDLRSKPRVSG